MLTLTSFLISSAALAGAIWWAVTSESGLE